VKCGRMRDDKRKGEVGEKEEKANRYGGRGNGNDREGKLGESFRATNRGERRTRYLSCNNERERVGAQEPSTTNTERGTSQEVLLY